jgi:PAS domain S-box-containing protein
MERIDFSVDIVAIVTACAGVLVFAYNRIIRPLYLWSSNVIDSLHKINAIHEQMFTNGGKTMRDAVNRIENRLTLLEKQQAVYIMDTPEGIFQSDEKGELIYVNRTICRMTGMTERELLGNGWLNCISETDRERVDKAWEYALANQIEFNATFDIVPLNNGVVTVSCTANPLRTIDNRLMGYMGLIDIING